jgi:hypothetical protein
VCVSDGLGLDIYGVWNNRVCGVSGLCVFVLTSMGAG